MTGTFEIVLRWKSEDGQHVQQVSRNFIQMRSELAAARREGD
jgi:hypothetical protein